MVEADTFARCRLRQGRAGQGDTRYNAVTQGKARHVGDETQAVRQAQTKLRLRLQLHSSAGCRRAELVSHAPGLLYLGVAAREEVGKESGAWHLHGRNTRESRRRGRSGTDSQLRTRDTCPTAVDRCSWRLYAHGGCVAKIYACFFRKVLVNFAIKIMRARRVQVLLYHVTERKPGGGIRSMIQQIIVCRRNL